MPLRRRSLPAAVGALLLLAPAGAAAEPPAAPLPRAEARITTVRGALTLQVEVARTGAERERGLMERTALGAQAGMLFLYPAPRSGEAGFWMFRTRLPLDIAFMDPAGRILALLTMEPCPDGDPARCPVYRPGVAYQSALEVNAGFFARHGVRPGDQVEWLSTP